MWNIIWAKANAKNKYNGFGIWTNCKFVKKNCVINKTIKQHFTLKSRAKLINIVREHLGGVKCWVLSITTRCPQSHNHTDTEHRNSCPAVLQCWWTSADPLVWLPSIFPLLIHDCQSGNDNYINIFDLL